MYVKKQIRKVLSCVLAGVLVLSGVGSIGIIKAKASEGVSTLKWTGVLKIGNTWNWSSPEDAMGIADGITPTVTNPNSTLELTGIPWNDLGASIKVENIADFNEPYITVVTSETSDGKAREFAVLDFDYKNTYVGANNSEEYDGYVEGDPLVPATTTSVSGALDKGVTVYNIIAAGRTVTGVYVHEKGVNPFLDETSGTEKPVQTATVPVETEEVPIETPSETVARTTADQFDIRAGLWGFDWSFIESEPVTIKGNGNYAMEMYNFEDDNIMMLWLDSYSLGYDNDLNIKVQATTIKIGDRSYDVSDANWWYRYCESLEEAAEGTNIDSSGYKANGRRLTYRKPYEYYYDDKTGLCDESKGYVDAFHGEDISIEAGETITFFFTVSGMSQNSNSDSVELLTPTPPVMATPSVEIERTTTEQFDVTATLYAPNWSVYQSQPVMIKGNGNYAIEIVSPSEMEDIMFLWLDAGMLGYDNDLNIKIESTTIKIGKKVYSASDANWWYRICTSFKEAAEGIEINESDEMKVNCRRLTYRNPYMNWCDEATGLMYNEQGIDALDGETIAVKEGETITLYVTVSGMATDNPDANITIPDVGILPEVTDTPETPVPTPVITVTPQVTDTPSPTPWITVTPAVTETPSPTPLITVTPVPDVTPGEGDTDIDLEEDAYDEEEEEDEDAEDLEKGDTFQKSGFIYTLLSSKSVTVSGYAKNANSLMIGNTVTYKGKKYKIVGIDSEAFSDMKSLKTITVGANVKSVGKKAFSGCKKLKTIQIKSKKIVKVGNNALKNINGFAKIYVPKKKYGAYKVLFRKKGQKTSVKVVKGTW